MLFKYYIILLFLFFSDCLKSQINHVHNGDFEYETSAISCGPSLATLFGQDEMEEYWRPCWPWNVPKQSPYATASVGSSDHFCYDGIKGSRYGNCGGYEYIVAPLKKNIVSGKFYYCEFYTWCEPKKNAGIRFYNTRPTQWKSDKHIHDDGEAHVDGEYYSHTGVLHAGKEWYKCSKYWTADGDYSWIALGSFDGNTDCLQIDGIRVIEVGSSECPEWNLIENVDYWDDISLTYASSYVTAVGTNIDNGQDDGPVHIHNVSKITLKSEREVMMEADFSVDEGGELNAFIAPCNADCFPPSVNAGPDKVVCEGTVSGGTSVNIGISTDYNPDYTYSWSAIPTTAITNLSCTDCSNPTILASGSSVFSGAQYILTVTNNCGQTATDIVNVIFDTNWSGYAANVNAYNINATDYINFDLTCSSHTEWIEIDIYKNSDNTLVYSKRLKRGDDFITIPFHWTIDQYLKVCDDYYIKIQSKNFCNPTLSSIQTIPWIRNRTISVVSPLPNVFTPPNPPNEKLCYNATGVDEYEITVNDPSGGSTLYSNSGDYAPTGGCLWDGTCNGVLSTCYGGFVPNGAYPVIVKFKNCSNEENIAHMVHVFIDPMRLGNTTDENNDEETRLFPNPNNGSFTIIPSIYLCNNYTIEITDNINKLIYKESEKSDKKLNLRIDQFGKGIYYIKIYNSTQNYINKIIVN